MVTVKRFLDFNSLLKKKSFFLLGPRQTGKSFLIRKTLDKYKYYDLLDTEVFIKLSRNLKLIEQELSQNTKIIIIDEIQRLPLLLNEVHRLIENYNINFLLTGSSARKLRRGGVNLLGGRARSRYFHPLIYFELGKQFDIMRALNFGTLPSIYFSDAPEEDLNAYSGDYLQNEIANEGLTRNIPAFSRFLEVAALSNSNLINYTNIANDAQVPVSTVQEYFKILKDTLIAFELPCFKKTIKRKSLSTSKFYFFDVGVVRNLQQRGFLKEKTPEMGEAFETYIAHELKSFIDYSGKGSLSYWRSKSGFEVDFILNETIAIEVKTSRNISPSDLKGLKAFREENMVDEYMVVCFEKDSRTVAGIQIIHWKKFLSRLWGTS